jgi:hypothetical protein
MVVELGRAKTDSDEPHHPGGSTCCAAEPIQRGPDRHWAEKRSPCVSPQTGTERWYGAGGEEMAPSSLANKPTECPDAPS